MALNTRMTDLAQVISADLAAGRASRQRYGGKGPAFGWTQGLPKTVADFCTTISSDSLNLPVTMVYPSGTPADEVAPGAPKPKAAEVQTVNVTLTKFAGYAEVQTESVLGTAGLLPAVASVLGAGALLAFEDAAIAELDTNAGESSSGASWLAAITAAQGKVLGAGGVPGTIVVSHADFGALMGEISGAGGFAASPESPVGTLYGSQIHVSPKAPAGTAYVFDPNAVIAIEHTDSPMVTVDPYSKSTENLVRVVGELFAAPVVVHATHVVQVTKA